MSLIGNGEGRALLILTDAESRLIREQLFPGLGGTNSAQHQQEASEAFTRGLRRGVEKMAEELKERTKKK